MQSIEMSDLDRVLDSWDELLQEFPTMKRDLLEDLGKKLLSGVRGEIRGTGTVQSWQERYLGSKNGYVAVRPLKTATGTAHPASSPGTAIITGPESTPRRCPGGTSTPPCGGGWSRWGNPRCRPWPPRLPGDWRAEHDHKHGSL